MFGSILIRCKMTPDNIKDIPLEKLAEQRYGLMDTAPNAILIDNEIERQKRMHQHQLDLDLVMKQVRWMKFSVLAGVLSALLGVILGWLLQRNWPPAQPQNITPKVQSETSSSTSVDRKEKVVTVPSEPPLKKTPNHRLDTDRQKTPTGQP